MSAASKAGFTLGHSPGLCGLPGGSVFIELEASFGEGSCGLLILKAWD